MQLRRIACQLAIWHQAQHMSAVFHVNECVHAHEVEILAVSNVGDCVQTGEVDCLQSAHRSDGKCSQR